MADISQIKIGITTYNIKDSASYKKPSGGIPSSDLALFSNLGNAGTSKYLREDGTWAEPVGGNITTPTLLTAPTSSTTTYTKDGNTLNFYIGQFCRVADATMNTGYKFYQLADLNNGVAAWQEMGTPLERTALSVTSNNPSLLTSLRSSAVITVTDEDDNEVFSGTLPQTRTLKLTPGISYTVSAAPVTGYTTPSSQTFEAEYEGIRSIDMEYDTTILTVVLASDTGEADLSNVTITVTDTTASSTISAQQDGTYLIPTSHEYSVEVSDDVEGYDAPTAATGTASGTTASVTMTYTEFTGYVDLGLPSGTKWAVGNICKDAQGNYSIGNETDYGAYFAWGDITGYNESENHSFTSSNYNSTRVNGTLISGISENILANSGFDAARELIGGNSRMATQDMFQELLDYTDSSFVSVNSKYVLKCVNRQNQNKYICLSLPGWIDNGTSVAYQNQRSIYLSSTYTSSSNSVCLQLISSNNTKAISSFVRYIGRPIRPVIIPHTYIIITLNPTDGTSVSGKTVTVTDSEGVAHTGTTDANGQVALQGVANGSCTVSVTDYIVYSSGKTITVNSSSRTFTIQVAYESYGVFAYYSDGSLKSEAEADSNAIGVAVITSNCSFVIDKNFTSNNEEIIFGGYGKDLSNIGVVVSNNSTIASADFDGEDNTTKIINACAGYTYNGVTGARACENCRAAFNGQGYMGSFGEWQEAYNNITAVNNMLTKIGGDTVAIAWYWCSTPYDASYNNWVVSMLNGNGSSGGRRNSSHVRAFRSL